MVRTLTANATWAKGMDHITPINIVKIEFPAPTGTKWYSDQTLGDGDASAWNHAEARVVNWGRIAKALQLGRLSPISDLQILLRDEDKTLRGYYDDVQVPRSLITIYQHFEGLDEADLIVLAKGIVNSPGIWDETAALLSLTLTDISTYYPQDIGHVADKDTFEEIWKENEDRVLPLVYGRVYRGPAVWTTATHITYLVQPMGIGFASGYRYLEDGFGFTQRCVSPTGAEPTPTPTPTATEEMTFLIGRELVKGYVCANIFYYTERAVDLETGNTTTADATNNYSLVDSGLGTVDDTYVGFSVSLTPTGMPVAQTRLITGYDAATKRILFQWPFVDAGGDWEVPTGFTYSIVSVEAGHAVGTPVIEWRADGYVYIVNDAPSKQLLKIEAQARRDISVTDGGETQTYNADGWLEIPDSWYSVNRNDSTSYAALGRNVTTVTFRVPPTVIPDLGITTNEIRVSIEGIEDVGDGTGTLIVNPVDIVENMLTNSDYGLGLAGGDLDSTAFTNASASAAFLKMGFAHDSERGALDLIADVAFQGRCALVWEEGLASIAFLTNSPGSSAATINEAHRVLDTLRKSNATFDEIVTEVTARWTERGEGRTYKRVDSTAETAFGRRARTLDLWCYARREYVRYVSSFYLFRWKRLWDMASLATYLTHIELQRADWATLNVTSLWSSQLAHIDRIDHGPGSGTSRLMDTILFRMRLPRWGGCSTTCEDDCTVAACETGCEAYNCKTSDETDGDDDDPDCEAGSCQTACMNICVTQCQLYDQTGLPTPTPTPTPTPSPSPTPTVSGATPTPSPTVSGPTPTPTPTVSGPTPSPTPTASGPTPSPTASGPTPTATPTLSGPTASGPTPTPTVSGPTPTPTPTVSGPTPTPTPTVSGPTPTPTLSGPTVSGPTPSPTPTVSGPTPTPTPEPAECCFDCDCDFDGFPWASADPGTSHTCAGNGDPVCDENWTGDCDYLLDQGQSPCESIPNCVGLTCKSVAGWCYLYDGDDCVDLTP